MVVDWHKFTSFANLAIGNSRRFNCKVRGYQSKISLSIMTVYLLFFLVGIFAGELTHATAINIENAVGMVGTVMIASLGTNILYQCWQQKIKNKFLTVVTIMIMGAQTAYVFNLFSVPIVNSLFQLATSGSMLVLYVYAQNKDRM